MSEPAAANAEDPQTNGDASRKHDNIDAAESEAKQSKSEVKPEMKTEVKPAKKAEPAEDSDSDSDDDVPMCQRLSAGAGAKKPAQAAVVPSSKAGADSDDSDDDVPLKSLPQQNSSASKPKEETKPAVVKQEKKPKQEKKQEAPPKRAKGKVIDSDSDDSDDDIPLKTIAKVKDEKPAAVKAEKPAASRPGRKATKKPIIDDSSDSDDDKPLASPVTKKAKAVAKPSKKRPKPKSESDSDSDDDVPLKKVAKPSKKRPKPKSESDSDSDDDVPLGQVKKKVTATKKKPAAKKAKKEGDVKKEVKPKKDEPERFKWWLPENQVQHKDVFEYVVQGVLFPPVYEPHGIKMLYDGEPVELEAEAEEAATFYAQKIETEYVQRPVFNKNFWKDWQVLLGKAHTIQSLEKCDFRPIYDHLQEEKEKKKSMTKEEKLAVKEAKEKVDLHFGWASIDKHKEKIGNYRVEIPGLFMGRGEHPKQGKIKARTSPEDVTLNMSADAPEPPIPPNMEGHSWGGIVHNKKATWLAMYKDSICGETKYVFLNANSTYKGQSDMAKFEKARLLKDHIEGIRKDYMGELTNVDDFKMQRSTALYLIDNFALRAGGDKDTEEEADTVGCCSLRAEHLEFEEDEDPPEGESQWVAHLNFLGKDSIVYDQRHRLDKKVWKNLKKLQEMARKRTKKIPEQDLFNTLNPGKMNSYLTAFMPGLTAKVFRTYNASITLDRLCQTPLALDEHINQKMVKYNQWNRDVAVLCNHQKAKSKTFDASMEKVKDKVKDIEVKLVEAKAAKKEAKKNKDEKAVTKFKKQMVQLQDRIDAIEAQMQTKEDLATVSLGTSKINYLDPRISVAWCKRQDVPLTKVFPKTLIDKFEWATDVDEDWRF